MVTDRHKPTPVEHSLAFAGRMKKHVLTPLRWKGWDIRRVSWRAKKTNAWVLKKAGVKRELLDTVKARNLASYGHTTSLQPVTAVRNLGIYLDGDVSMRTHVSTTVLPYYARYEVFAILCHVLYADHASVPRHQQWTSAALWWPVHLTFYCSDSSQS